MDCDEPAVVDFLVEKNLKSAEEKTPAQKAFLHELKEYLKEKTHRTNEDDQLLADVNKILKECNLSNYIVTVLSKHLPKFFIFSTPFLLIYGIPQSDSHPKTKQDVHAKFCSSLR